MSTPIPTAQPMPPHALSDPSAQLLSLSWRRALLSLGVVMLGIVLLYLPTGSAMVGIWWRSGTFAHAFIVPPISLWLIWRQREWLATMAPRPQPWMLLPMALLAAGWLAGDLVVVNSVTQLAFVAMLVLAVPLVLGLRVASAITFPLLFVFFCVPIGEFLLPILMEGTADFTVAALSFTGIPVYREGLMFVIPSGSWSVVEACSGVRYLIASLMVGTLFAYLNYTTAWRRAAFIGVAIIAPIVANWLRAYMIVMIGHLSSNRLAVGVDHLIYGWVFFGLVIMVMFVIGARWAEPEVTAQERAAARPSTQHGAVAWSGWAFTVAAALVVVGLSVVAKAQLDRDSLAAAAPSLRLPADLPGGWVGHDDPVADWTPHFEQPSTSAERSYTQAGNTVGVKIFYYRSQTYESKLVSSNNTLVQSEDKTWNRTALPAVELDVGGAKTRLEASRLSASPSIVRAVNLPLLVWQTYWIDGQLMTSDHRAKLRTALSRVSGRGDDGATVVLFAKGDDEQQTAALLARFTQSQLPALVAELGITSARR